MGSELRKAKARLAAQAAAIVTGLSLISACSATAADWSATEIQYQYGKLDVPFSGGDTSNTHIVTLQYAGGFSFGDAFFFIDLLDDSDFDGFNDKDAYTEGYAYFSSAKILKASYGGPIKDVGVVVGYNYDADADFLAYLPGAYIDWAAPGFAFLRTQFTAVIDDSRGVANGGAAPTKDTGFEFDVSWAYPFKAFGQIFSIEGHIQVDSAVDGEFGRVPYSILGQPQFRWDVGYALSGKKDQFFIGTEYQFWINKLGDSTTDESAFQALGVWRF